MKTLMLRVFLILTLTILSTSFQLNPLMKTMKQKPLVKQRQDYSQTLYREDLTKSASSDQTRSPSLKSSDEWSVMGPVYTSTLPPAHQAAQQQQWNQPQQQTWNPQQADVNVPPIADTNYPVGSQAQYSLDSSNQGTAPALPEMQKHYGNHQRNAQNGGNYGNKGGTVNFEDNFSIESSIHQVKSNQKPSDVSGGIAAAAGTISAAYTVPGSNSLSQTNSYNSPDPYEAGSFKSLAAADTYSISQSHSVVPEPLSSVASDNSVAAGSFGAGSYGSGGGSYGGSGGHSGSGSNGGEKGNVVYTLVPDGSSGTGGTTGLEGDTHSHLLSAIVPLFLLSTIFLPLGVSIGTAAAASSTSGRRRRETNQTEVLTTVPTFLTNISPSEAFKVQQEMIVRYMMCSGLADESNHCLERLACLEASPDAPARAKLDSNTLQI